jgi:hypothetical protein
MNANEMDEFQFPAEAEGFKELVREFSPSGQLVAVVGVRPDEAYTYAIYFWDTTDYEYSGAGWAPGGGGGIYSDLDSAVSEANSELLSRSRHGNI